MLKEIHVIIFLCIWCACCIFNQQIKTFTTNHNTWGTSPLNKRATSTTNVKPLARKANISLRLNTPTLAMTVKTTIANVKIKSDRKVLFHKSPF